MRIKAFKIMYVCILLSSFVFAGPSARPQDVAGWSKAKWGMSEPEIQAAFSPGVTKLADAVKYDDQYFDLVLNSFKLANLDFTVRFLMNSKSDRLAGVSLRSADSKLSPEMFWALEKELTQSYGPPGLKTDSRNRLVTSWDFPSTRIELLYGDSPLAGRFIYLNLRSTPKAASSKP